MARISVEFAGFLLTDPGLKTALEAKDLMTKEGNLTKLLRAGRLLDGELACGERDLVTDILYVHGYRPGAVVLIIGHGATLHHYFRRPR
jgi:hypothetical protein